MSGRYGDLIKQRLEELNRTPEDLAQDLSTASGGGWFSPEYVRAVTSNQIFPSPGARQFIAEALGMDAAELEAAISGQADTGHGQQNTDDTGEENN